MTTLVDNTLGDNEYIGDWHDVDWHMVNSNVTKLRYRIFTSCKNKDFRKVKKLQKLLLKSNSNLLQSIRRVTQINSGKVTPGIDNDIRLTPADRLALFLDLEMKTEGLYGWEPKAVKRTYIPKPDGRQRPLGIPTIKDRVWQNVVKNALEPEWEQQFENSSYGFRPSRSYNDALNRVYVALAKKTRLWVVDADISRCFDNIDHDYLIRKLIHFPGRSIIEKWLKAGIFYDGVWSESGGTPQGGIISPLLCNIALHGMESEIGGKLSPDGYVKGPRLLVRYADDFVVLCTTHEEAQASLEDVKRSLAKRGLEIAANKTKVTHLVDGFDFLGFNVKLYVRWEVDYNKLFKVERTVDGVNFYKRFDVNRTLLLIKPSLKSIKNCQSKIKSVFTSSKQTNVGNLIDRLNPILRGWALSKNCWHSNRTFHAMDSYVYNLCWRWIHRIHPNKNNRWLKKRYFNHLQKYGINNRWVFTDPDTGSFLYQLKWTRNNQARDDQE